MSSIQNAIYRLTHTVLTLADIALKPLSIIKDFNLSVVHNVNEVRKDLKHPGGFLMMSKNQRGRWDAYSRNSYHIVDRIRRL
jgi:hypothetical protein